MIRGGGARVETAAESAERFSFFCADEVSVGDENNLRRRGELVGRQGACRGAQSGRGEVAHKLDALREVRRSHSHRRLRCCDAEPLLAEIVAVVVAWSDWFCKRRSAVRALRAHRSRSAPVQLLVQPQSTPPGAAVAISIDPAALEQDVKALSGAHPITLAGREVRITERSSEEGLALARAWLKAQYTALGFVTHEQSGWEARISLQRRPARTRTTWWFCRRIWMAWKACQVQTMMPPER